MIYLLMFLLGFLTAVAIVWVLFLVKEKRKKKFEASQVSIDEDSGKISFPDSE